MADSSNPTKVVTGTVRLSFVNLVEPRVGFVGQAPKYSVLLLIPKEDTKTVEAIKRAQQAALDNGKASTFGGSIPKKWKDTFRDGDEEQDTEQAPEYAGHYFMNVGASEKYPPVLVDQRRQKLSKDDASVAFYSGMYARVSMNAFPFNAQGSKGVSFGINAVQKVRDGEPLSGAVVDVDSDFDDLGDDDVDDLI